MRSILCANFDRGFKKPEMGKRRLCVVISPPIGARFGLCTVAPLSTLDPETQQASHDKLDIPFNVQNIAETSHAGQTVIGFARLAFTGLICCAGQRSALENSSERLLGLRSGAFDFLASRANSAAHHIPVNILNLF
ncbi:type II toxin-antitoxin system PemK/MazF family toxin [uncultured Lentibacter sp.]|uniref:type II toxin-antitoxin system PemK/MazF family toxin n=1 Tax=uncultured Lentibacter sp. TaxID=1659309 RepID=UPI003452AAA0